MVCSKPLMVATLADTPYGDPHSLTGTCAKAAQPAPCFLLPGEQPFHRLNLEPNKVASGRVELSATIFHMPSGIQGLMAETEDSIVTAEGAALRARAQKRRERLLRGQNERLSRIQGCPSGDSSEALPSPPTASASSFREKCRGEQSGFSFEAPSDPREPGAHPSLGSSPASSFSWSPSFASSQTALPPGAHVPIAGFLAGLLLWLGCRAEWWSHSTHGNGAGGPGAPRWSPLRVPLSLAASFPTMHTLCTVLFCVLRLKSAASAFRGFPPAADLPGRSCRPWAVLRCLCTVEVVLPLLHLLYTVVLSRLSRTALTTIAVVGLAAVGHKVRQLACETLAFWAPTTDPATPPSFWAQCMAFGLAYYGHALAAYRGARDYAADHALFSVAAAGGVTVAWVVGTVAAS